MRRRLAVGLLLILSGPVNAVIEAVSPAIIAELGLSMLTGNCRNFYREGKRWPNLPRRDDYDDIFFEASDVLRNIRFQSDGPVNMRGMFWLKIDGDVPEVVSFDETNEGGGALGDPLAGTPLRRRQRIMSNRNWGVTFQGTEFTRSMITGAPDVTVEWVLRGGTAEAPVAFDMYLDFAVPFTCLRASTEGCGKPFPQWSMFLQNTPTFNPHITYQNSVVWRRESTFDGTSSSYEAIQIADENGVAISPAFENFVQAATPLGPMLTKELRVPSEPPQCGRPFWCFLGLLC